MMLAMSNLRRAWVFCIFVPFFWLVGCSSQVVNKPAALTPLVNTAALGEVWKIKVGSRIEFPLQMAVHGQNVLVAGSKGSVALINTLGGTDIWRLNVGSNVSGGVGFDGHIAAITTVNNELVAIQSGANSASIVWRKNMLARAYTPPLVAGGRIFVLTGDRSVQAFDAETGAQLWTLKRTSDPLILSQVGTLGVYHNTLLVGDSGHLLGVNPDNGQIQWEASIATTRATNDIERLIDLVGSPSRVGDSVCVRAYQVSIACVDAYKGITRWSKTTKGSIGIGGDADMLVSTESDGTVKAWSRATGDILWTNDKLAFRGLSAPLVIASSVVIGDSDGFVHVLNKANGEFTARFKTDTSAIIAAPVASGNTVVIATARGGIFAYSPK